MTYALVRVSRPAPGHRTPSLGLADFARATGCHPDLVRRFVTLGLLDASRDRAGELWFSPAEVGALARIQRLRVGFALNYASAGLVADLLDRIAALEAALRRTRQPPP